MRRTLARFAAAACLALLAGCFLAGESYQPVPVPAARAVVYVYRPFSVIGSQTFPLITCGRESIEIDNGAYRAFIVETGPLRCSAAGGSSPAELKFEARAGEQYFIREVVSGGGAQLTMMSAKTGESEIQDCTKQVASDSGGSQR
jgi:hypothetical protein